MDVQIVGAGLQNETRHRYNADGFNPTNTIQYVAKGRGFIEIAGKKHPVAVIWQKRVLHLMEHPKILGPGHPNGGQIFIAVAPGDVIPILQLADPGIVGVFKREIRRSVDKADGPGLNVPVDAVLGETDVQPRHPAGVVATEHPGESAPEGNGGAVENAIGIGQGVPFDDGVSSIPPQG